MSETANVRFEPAGRTIQVPAGSTLLAAAREAGLHVDAPCAGTGRCGSCRVEAQGDLTPATRDEQELLGGAGIRAGKRLACRARVLGDVVVTIEPAAESRVLVAGVAQQVDLEPPDERGIELIGTITGAAVDVGTTTLVLSLVDLRTGEPLETEGGLNPQRAFGADVLSRVAHASAGGGPELQRLIVTEIESMLSSVLEAEGLSTERVAEAIVVGNTAMTGLLLGADVSPLGTAPYQGGPVEARTVSALELGLAPFPGLEITVLPAASAFIGSDITAGILATGLAEREAPALFVDLGTNGEIVLAAAGRLLAASAAVGPAFEGASIECGMRAEAGAIERVTRAGESLEFGVIGDREPAGLCGSGLLDLAAELLDAGIIEPSGRFAEDPQGLLGDRLTERDGVRSFVVHDENDVVLTQRDVRQLQLAVAAVRTGVELVLAEAGLAPEDVSTVIVAGGFGYHVRPESLVRVGLVPPAWADRLTFAGNTALAGARMALVNSAVRERASQVAAGIETLDLASHPAFQQRFLAALEFPA